MQRIAVIGATGLVGRNLLEVLEKSHLEVSQLYALASKRSLDKMVKFRQKTIGIKDVSDFDFSLVDVAFFMAGSEVASQYVPKALQANCWVIDNSSYFRLKETVPLVVPEVNAYKLKALTQPAIIANPNCSTIQMCVALQPIYEHYGLNRIIVSTYQSVSGVGQAGIRELIEQTGALLNGRPVKPKVFPKQIAFNVLPQVDVFLDNGYTKEEMKLIQETQKILDDQALKITATAVRVPTLFGHSESIYFETEALTTVEDIQSVLKNAEGVQVLTEPGSYPTIMDNAVGHHEVFVGRIRQDLYQPNGFHMWVVADNVLKGAATNAVQILEHLVSFCG